MSDDANNATPNAPVSPIASPVSAHSGPDTSNSNPAAAPESPSAAKSQSRSPIKIIIPIILLVGVVFGITLFSQYAPPPKKDKSTKGSSATVLTFGKSIRAWNPGSRELTDQIFPSFYEPGQTEHPAAFWLENQHSSPVTMELEGVAGSLQNTGGRFAPIPPDVMDQLFVTSVLSGFPQGLSSGLPLGLVATAANLDPNRMNWQSFKHSESAHPQYKIPAAPGSTHVFPYQWGIFELRFIVDGIGKPKESQTGSQDASKNASLTAFYEVRVDGTDLIDKATLSVGYEGVEAFDVSPQAIDIGKWNETTDVRHFNVDVYSLTRGPNRTSPNNHGDLEPPSVIVRMPGGKGDAGNFVTVALPVRAPESRLFDFMVSLSKAQNKGLKIESVYQYPVTVNSKAGEERMDIGPFERDLVFTLPGMKEPRTVRLKGMVTGDIALADQRTDIEVPSYSSSTGIIFRMSVVTKLKDAVVTLVSDDCSPKFVKYKLTKVSREGTQGYYELSVEIPKEGPAGSWSGVVVMELKGTRPQRIRIPIKGTAKF